MTVEMMGVGNSFVLVPLNHPRGRTVRELEEAMPKGSKITKTSNVQQGIEEARKLAGEKGCVVVAGSVVLAGEVLKILGEDQFEV